MGIGDRRRRHLRPLLVVAVALAVLSPAGPAQAQEDDPYGSTTTTTQPPAQATISLTVESGPRGTAVGVFACGYAPTATGGSVTFDGRVVASGLVVDAEGCLTTAGAPAGGQDGAPLTIRVPDDSRPGNRNVCSVVAGYNTPCARFQVRNNESQVRGVSVERDADVAARSGTALPFVGTLPLTGSSIVLLLAMAAVLLVVGRRLLSASRRGEGARR